MGASEGGARLQGEILGVPTKSANRSNRTCHMSVQHRPDTPGGCAWPPTIPPNSSVCSRTYGKAPYFREQTEELGVGLGGEGEACRSERRRGVTI